MGLLGGCRNLSIGTNGKQNKNTTVMTTRKTDGMLCLYKGFLLAEPYLCPHRESANKLKHERQIPRRLLLGAWYLSLPLLIPFLGMYILRC